MPISLVTQVPESMAVCWDENSALKREREPAREMAGRTTRAGRPVSQSVKAFTEKKTGSTAPQFPLVA